MQLLEVEAFAVRPDPSPARSGAAQPTSSSPAGQPDGPQLTAATQNGAVPYVTGVKRHAEKKAVDRAKAEPGDVYPVGIFTTKAACDTAPDLSLGNEACGVEMGANGAVPGAGGRSAGVQVWVWAGGTVW